MVNLFRLLIDFIYPRICYFCEKEGRYLCQECIRSYLNINWDQKCFVCDVSVSRGFMHEECREVSHLDGLIYVTTYSKVVSDVLKDIKYKYYFDVINSLSDIMADYLKVYKFDDITISFAPIHAVKLRSRGFDQSELLAKSIADKSNFDFMKLLYRNRQTLTQVGLSKVERESNLKGAFNLRDTLPYLPKSVMLIDDIFTTGSTLNECAKVLKEGGVGQVYGFVFAKSRT